MILENQKKLSVLFLLLLLITTNPVRSIPIDNKQMSEPLWTDDIGSYYNRVDCSADGRYILAGTDDGIIRFYNRTGSVLWTHHKTGKSVQSVSVSSDGQIAAAVISEPDAPSSRINGELLCFDYTGMPSWQYSADMTIEQVIISEDGTTIVAAGTPNLYFFDRNGTLLGRLDSKGSVRSLASSCDGTTGVAAVDLGWQERKGNVMVFGKNGAIFLNYPTKYQAQSSDISADGKSIIAADSYRLYAFSSNRTPQWNFSSNPSFKEVKISKNGQYSVAGSQYFLRVFNESGTQLWKYETAGFIHAVGLSRTGDLIVAGASDGVYVFAGYGNLLWHFKTEKFFSDVAISDNGDYFVAGTTGKIFFFNKWGNSTNPESEKTAHIPINISSASDDMPFQVSNRPQSAAQIPLIIDILAVIAVISTIARLKIRK